MNYILDSFVYLKSNITLDLNICIMTSICVGTSLLGSIFISLPGAGKKIGEKVLDIGSKVGSAVRKNNKFIVYYCNFTTTIKKNI